MASQHMPTRADDGAALASIAPEVGMRLVGALLALAISAVHVADQGGVTALTSPDWMGWSYRLIEVGGVLTAVALLLAPVAPLPARSARLWSALARRLGWAAGVLLGAGPFVAYILSRTMGMPGDSRDVGRWGYWLGTVSLLVEAALVALSVSVMLSLRHLGRPQAARFGRRCDAAVTRPPDSSGRMARARCSLATTRSLSSTSPSLRWPTRPARCTPSRPHCREASRGVRLRPRHLKPARRWREVGNGLSRGPVTGLLPRRTGCLRP